MRIRINKNLYIVKRKRLWAGEDTPDEDLWKAGFRVGVKKILWIKFLIYTK